MVRIVKRSQSANRKEWLQELEIQKRQIQERRELEKLEAMAYISTDNSLMDQPKEFKEFGGRRRPLNDIIKLEHACLPRVQVEKEKKKERIPFSGAVQTKEPNYHRTRAFFEESNTSLKESANMEWKLALEKQIQEKKDRIAKEKELERHLELLEIGRFENQEKRNPTPPKSSKPTLTSTASRTSKTSKTTIRESKLPKLKYFCPKTPPKLELLPSISKFSNLIGRTSQLSFSSSKTGSLSVKNPQVLLKTQDRNVRKPLKILQKFPVRSTDLTTPPSLGKRSWPAGSKSVCLPLLKTTSKPEYLKDKKQETCTNQVNNSGIDLNESLERNKAIQELQELWNDYEHEHRVEYS